MQDKQQEAQGHKAGGASLLAAACNYIRLGIMWYYAQGHLKFQHCLLHFGRQRRGVGKALLFTRIAELHIQMMELEIMGAIWPTNSPTSLQVKPVISSILKKTDILASCSLFTSQFF